MPQLASPSADQFRVPIAIFSGIWQYPYWGVRAAVPTSPIYPTTLLLEGSQFDWITVGGLVKWGHLKEKKPLALLGFLAVTIFAAITASTSRAVTFNSLTPLASSMPQLASPSADQFRVPIAIFSGIWQYP